MKELTVKNVHAFQGQKITRDGNEFTVKTIIPEEDTLRCRANFVELEPGNHAYGYHYHEANEEVFYIISGTGVIRTSDGDLPVMTGDAIGFPRGAKGAHVLSNNGTEKLVYIDFGTTIVPEIVHLPDTGKVMVIGKEVNGIYDK